MGNPGRGYAGTRHNVGFRVVDRLIRRWGVQPRRSACSSWVGRGQAAGQEVWLAMPQTFMNASGQAVACLMRRLGIAPGSLLVVCDDISLPLGMIRLRPQGSEGGHLGLGSILQEVGSDEIPRLRVGIQAGRVGGEDLTDFVLSGFHPPEKPLLEEGLDSAVEACEVWVASGMEAAMSRFNRKVGRQ